MHPNTLDRLWQENGRLSGLPREEWDLKMDFFDEPTMEDQPDATPQSNS